MKILFLALYIWGFGVISLYSEDTGSLYGTVTDQSSGEPLVGVNIIIPDAGFGTTTGKEGNFYLDEIPAGIYQLEFSYIGYLTVLKTDIMIRQSKPAILNVKMQETLIEGEGVTVTAGYFVEEQLIQPSTVGLSREEIRRFPGGFEDVVRTVSTLPGVSVNASGGRNDLLVRGGGPSENLYIINNIEVPNINHFGTQGTSGGTLSFINLDFVDNVSFSTGGFSARHGDKMSSVLSLTMTEGRNDRLGGKAIVSATQYGLNLEGPINQNSNFIFSARKSYLDLIFKSAGFSFIPVYSDFNLLMNYKLSPNDQLFLIGLGAIDEVDRDQNSEENRVKNAGILDNTQYQWIGGLNYRRLHKMGYLDFTLNSNIYKYRFSQIDQFEREYFKSKSDEHELNVKFQNYLTISKNLGLFTGISSKTAFIKNVTAFADTIYDKNGRTIRYSQLGVNRLNRIDANSKKFAAFAELDWTVNSRLNINLGVRSDYYTYIDNSFYFSPRFSLKYSMHPKHSIRLSSGIYYQSPSYVWVVNPANKKLRALQNQMQIAGWDYLLKSDYRISVEGYYKNYSDLPSGIIAGVTDFIVLTNTGNRFGGREDNFQSFGFFELTSGAKGKAYGLEISLQKKFSDTPYFGQASISIGRSEYTANNGKTYPGEFDQRFIFNFSGGYMFNSKWEISAKFRYFSGFPYTPVYRPSENPQNTGLIQNLPEEYLSSRLSAGHHLDIRMDRFININKWTMIVFLDLQNVYNYNFSVRPSYDFWNDKIVTENQIAFLPSIGVSLEF